MISHGDRLVPEPLDEAVGLLVLYECLRVGRSRGRLLPMVWVERCSVHGVPDMRTEKGRDDEGRREKFEKLKAVLHGVSPPSSTLKHSLPTGLREISKSKTLS